MKTTYKILASLLLIATLGACMGDKNPSDGEVEDKNPLVEEKSEDENKTGEQVSEEKEEEAENTEDVASADLDADKVLDEMLDASKNLKNFIRIQLSLLMTEKKNRPRLWMGKENSTLKLERS